MELTGQGQPSISRRTPASLRCRLFRDSVQLCSGPVDLIMYVGRHLGGGHRVALAGGPRQRLSSENPRRMHSGHPMPDRGPAENSNEVSLLRPRGPKSRDNEWRDRRAASRAPLKEGVTWKRPSPLATPVLTHACLRAMTMSTTRHTTCLLGRCMKLLHHIESIPHRGYMSARAGTMATTRPTISALDNPARLDRGMSESIDPAAVRSSPRPTSCAPGASDAAMAVMIPALVVLASSPPFAARVSVPGAQPWVTRVPVSLLAPRRWSIALLRGDHNCVPIYAMV